MSILARMPSEQLRALRLALSSERLGGPYSPASLRPYGPAGQLEGLGRELSRLEALGMTPAQIAEVVRVAEELPRPPRITLVWTGPEEVGSESRDTGVVMREMFQQATRSVLVSGFAVYQGKSVFSPLAARMAQLPGLEVKMFLNIERARGDLRPEEEIVAAFAARFAQEQWPGSRLPSVFHDPRALAPQRTGQKRASLHAKCVIVDDLRVLVTSANFTEAAQERNIEVGVDVEDRALALSLRRQFESLVNSGELSPVPVQQRDPHPGSSRFEP